MAWLYCRRPSSIVGLSKPIQVSDDPGCVRTGEVCQDGIGNGCIGRSRVQQIKNLMKVTNMPIISYVMPGAQRGMGNSSVFEDGGKQALTAPTVHILQDMWLVRESLRVSRPAPAGEQLQGETEHPGHHGQDTPGCTPSRLPTAASAKRT